MLLQAFIGFHCTCLSLLKVTNAAPNSNPDLNGATANTPAPLVIPPSEKWEGADGPWSTFWLSVGSPFQTVSVLVSTASNQPLVVLPEGCPSGSRIEDCVGSRGGVFHINSSSTWINNNVTKNSIFPLAIEQNLNYSVNAFYGTDTVSLGLPESGAPSLDRQLVGGIASNEYFMGMFGLNPAATNFSDFNHPVQSYMSNLKSQNKIPSISYGYTAGNQYRFNKVLGSLTLGGYDASIIEHNDLTFAFNGDNSRDLTTNVLSISMSSSSGQTNLSSKWFPAFIDSTIPYMYLPVEVCQKFEEAFGLTYDNATDLYLVNDTLHADLLSQAANVTFTLTNLTSKVLVDIVLPYQAFDLVVSYPLVKNSSRYFPLRRAYDNTQTTLGRAFLQESYIVADYERSNFSIYQRKWDPDAVQNIQTILPLAAPAAPAAPNNQSTPQSKSAATDSWKLPLSAIIAIPVVGVFLIILVICCIILIRQRQQKLKQLQPGEDEKWPESPYAEMIRSPAPLYTPPQRRTELDATGSQRQSLELEAGPLPHVHAKFPKFTNSVGRWASVRGTLHELPAEDNRVFELVGSPAFDDEVLRNNRRIARVYQHAVWSR